MFSVKNLIYSFCPKKQMRKGLGCGGWFEGRGPADHRLRGSREPTLLKPDPLRFGSLLLLFVNLTQTMEETS